MKPLAIEPLVAELNAEVALSRERGDAAMGDDLEECRDKLRAAASRWDAEAGSRMRSSLGHTVCGRRSSTSRLRSCKTRWPQWGRI